MTTAPSASKFVYFFGGGKADGTADMNNLLGGKGAGLAEMTNLGIPVPPGFTITTEVCTAFYANGRNYPEGSRTQVRDGHRARREAASARKFGDPPDPLLVSRALRRPRVDARHDGHRPQPRPQRRHRRRAWRESPATRASPRTATAASCRCTATSCSASSRRRKTKSTRSRRSSRRRSTPAASTLDTELAGRRPQGARRRVQGRDQEAHRHATFPDDPWEQLWGADRRRLRLLGQPARRRPTAACTSIPDELGHRRQRAGDGLRQPGRRLRHRRRLHARPRRPASDASTASTWSTRRAKTWSPASARRSRSTRAKRDRRDVARRAHAGGLRRARPRLQKLESTTATCRTSSSPSRRASSGCCRPATASAPATAMVRIAVDMVKEG